MGTGHLMRCLALAQAWQEHGGTVHFAFVSVPPPLCDRLVAEGMELHLLAATPGSQEDAEALVAMARQVGAAWLVVDGYQFDAAYQKIIMDAGCPLLFVDDYGHASFYWAELVLNQNSYAEPAFYPHHAPTTQLLLGTRYTLLRREFFPWREWQRESPAIARKVLVTLGGSDPDNVTLTVIQALQQLSIEGIEVIVVVGGGNPHLETLQRALDAAPCSIRLEHNVTQMPDLMAWADVAVSAGGSTCWELAFMGLPTLVVVLSDNQLPIAAHLHDVGAAINLGRYHKVTVPLVREHLETLLHSQSQRSEMSRVARHLIDGQGTRRVIEAMQTEEVLHLREVGEQDGHLLWHWANEPAVRAISLTTQPIPWERHIEWLATKLQDPACHFYLATDHTETPVGQIRLDQRGPSATVSVSVDARFRGKGYGSRLIELATQRLFTETDVSTIQAYIKEENKASQRTFERAGFENRGIIEVQGQPVLLFVLEKGAES